MVKQKPKKTRNDRESNPAGNGPNSLMAVGLAALACIVYFGQSSMTSPAVLHDVSEIEKVFGKEDPAFDVKGYGETTERQMCREHVWPVLNEYTKLHNKMLDFTNDLKPRDRRFLVVSGFGEQGLGNRIQWMTTFFWLAVISDRAILFEDDPSGKVLVISDYLQSKYIDWKYTPQLVKKMQESGLPKPKFRKKDIESLFWDDGKTRTLNQFIDDKRSIVYLQDPWTAQV
jgi:hypothetical protein